jgi:DNA-damage-inducible protein J
MAQTNINIRMDSELKKQFGQFCEDVGMSMTTAICLFAKATVRAQNIPFEITADPFYSAANQERLRKAAAEMDAGVGTVHELTDTEGESPLTTPAPQC